MKKFTYEMLLTDNPGVKEIDMKQSMLLAVFLCFFFVIPPPASAEDISLRVPCKDGGTIFITGTWTMAQGTATLVLETTDCTHNGTLLSGTGTVNGSFMLNTIPTTADVSLATVFTGTLTKNGEVVDVTYHQNGSGNYSLIDEVLDGDLETTWKASGNIDLGVLQLLSINMAETFF